MVWIREGHEHKEWLVLPCSILQMLYGFLAHVARGVGFSRDCCLIHLVPAHIVTGRMTRPAQGFRVDAPFAGPMHIVSTGSVTVADDQVHVVVAVIVGGEPDESLVVRFPILPLVPTGLETLPPCVVGLWVRGAWGLLF